jgi:hypothetical protein
VQSQALVLRHLTAADLPAEWVGRLPAGQTFTITIVAEKPQSPPAKSGKLPESNPLFGIWRDNPAVEDVDAYMRKLRKGRFRAD